MFELRAIINKIRGRITLKDELTSEKLRIRFRAMGVEVGLYSYGCFDISRVPSGVTIGRYCSFSSSSQVFLRNHGVNFIGLTAYLYNETLGVVDRSMVEPTCLSIGDDVWVGHNSVLLPGVHEVGRGAVIAAGAVVTKPVPAYAVVAGNPARVIRMRFDERTITEIEKTRWWEWDLSEMKKMILQRSMMIYDPVKYFEHVNKKNADNNKNIICM